MRVMKKMLALVLALMLAFSCVAFAEGKTFTAGATTGFFGAETSMSGSASASITRRSDLFRS
jgi:hypothetical protein